MPAHGWECWLENTNASEESVEVDTGPSYVGRDINMPARGHQAPAREEYASPEMSM
jgi:hypothetical protein